MMTTVKRLSRKRKRAWNEEQDCRLVALVAANGPKQWESISREIPGRTGKQCRERWLNQLNPLLRSNAWSMEEQWVFYIMQLEQ